MHKVNRIQIGGFRRLREITIEMRPLMVLIGANGVGGRRHAVFDVEGTAFQRASLWTSAFGRDFGVPVADFAPTEPQSLDRDHDGWQGATRPIMLWR